MPKRLPNKLVEANDKLATSSRVYDLTVRMHDEDIAYDNTMGVRAASITTI